VRQGGARRAAPHRRDEAASSKRTAAGSSKRNHENEPPQDGLVVGAKQRREVTHWTEAGLDLPPLALEGGLLDLQVGEGLRLDPEHIGKTIALGLPSFVVRGAELEIGDVLKVMAPK
jgi:hypothetical protein